VGGSVDEVRDNEILHAPRVGSEGEEQRKEIYFAYSASLRIFGNIPDLDEITRRLGVVPSHTHRLGERRWPAEPPYKHDMWSYIAPVKKREPLYVHIDALWNTFREHKQYLLQLKKELTVDVFLGYTSDCDNAGVELPYQSLEIFRELQVPFGLSIIVL
jgi:Domain of unknown function (DUF4279)